jgi:hypothetical protein
MNEKHVVSLELAKQLKEAGWKKETEFCWALCADMSSTNFGTGEFRITTGGLSSETKVEHYPAPLATELLEELPDMSFDTGRREDKWIIFFQDNSKLNKVNVVRKDKNLCDALTKMWLYLRKENYE